MDSGDLRMVICPGRWGRVGFLVATALGLVATALLIGLVGRMTPDADRRPPQTGAIQADAPLSRVL